MEIPDMTVSIDERNFLIGVGERATAATATKQGATDQKDVTLGEIKLALFEADQRISDMQDPYEQSWLEFGEKWAKLTEANTPHLKAFTAYRKSFRGKYWKKEVAPKHWQSAEGYACIVSSA